MEITKSVEEWKGEERRGEVKYRCPRKAVNEIHKILMDNLQEVTSFFPMVESVFFFLGGGKFYLNINCVIKHNERKSYNNNNNNNIGSDLFQQL